LLASITKGCIKLYSVNRIRLLTLDLTPIVRKVSGINALVVRVTANRPSLEQVWVCGDLTKGLPSKFIEAALVLADLDLKYIKRLTGKAHSLMGKTIICKCGRSKRCEGRIRGHFSLAEGTAIATS
jgi:hypothetical protein